MGNYAIIEGMKVGIDTFGCNHGRSGTGSYLISLIKELQNQNAEDVSFELFGSEEDRFSYTDAGGNVTYHGVDAKKDGRLLWHQIKMGRLAKKQHYDAVLYPNGADFMPLFQSVPGIAVVNRAVSEQLHRMHGFLFRHIYVQILKHSNMIIASSQYVRKDLVSLGIKPEKIEVIHFGLDHSHFYPHAAFDNDEKTVTINPFSIKRPYLIYASRLQSPEKKHVELIKAFDLFKKKTGLPHRLVLAGADGDYSEAVGKAASEAEYASDILLTGYFPHESFPELYSYADACLFSSVSEGVGMPVLEAMAVGIPVACAKAGSLPEIAGDCALYFNPDDVEETSEAIKTVATDEKVRERLVKSGFEWTKRFSWEKNALKTIDVIRRVLQK